MMTFELILLAALLVVITLLAILYGKYTGLKRENAAMKEIIEINTKTIENLKASRVAVKEVIENFSSHDDVMKLVHAGKSVVEIAETLQMPENKVEMIIKFDKIKKEHPKTP